METKSPRIRFPKKLALQIGKDRPLLRVVMFYCVAKAIMKEGRFLEIAAVKQELSAMAGAGKSPKTIGRLFDRLVQHGLAERKGGMLYLISWEAFQEKFNMPRLRWYYIQLHPDVKIEHIAQALVIKDKQSECSTAFAMRVAAVPFIRETIQSVTGEAAVEQHQLNCFLQKGVGFDDDQRYVLSSHYTEKEQRVLRADVNVSYGTLKKLMGYKGCGSIAYVKRILHNKGLALVKHRVEVIANKTYTTVADRRTRLGYVRWNTVAHRLELIMPDSIDLLPFTTIPQRMEFKRKLKAREEAAAKPAA